MLFPLVTLYVSKSVARKRQNSCARSRRGERSRKKGLNRKRRGRGESRNEGSGRRRRGHGRRRRGPWRRNGSSGFMLKKSRPPDYGENTRGPVEGLVPVPALQNC
jgi:hypothetical protein